jgi:hypothetical protein
MNECISGLFPLTNKDNLRLKHCTKAFHPCAIAKMAVEGDRARARGEATERRSLKPAKLKMEKICYCPDIICKQFIKNLDGYYCKSIQRRFISPINKLIVPYIKHIFPRAITSCFLAFEEPSYIPLFRSRRYACKFIYCNGRCNKNFKAKGDKFSHITVLFHHTSFLLHFCLKPFVVRINTPKEVLNLG